MTEGNALAVGVSGARKVYKATPWSPEHVAVDDVSITVPQGVIHGILGPNGAGKTTTLKMLLGLVRPTAGTFEVLGRASHVPANRAQLGFLPEQPYFPVQLTAAEAMRLYARLGGLPGREIPSRTAELLSLVGLEDSGGTRLQAFSRGMLQRLGIAQALVGRPRVLVLDEPASGLDPVGQRDVRTIMLRLRDEGVTVVLSSHQLSEVEAVSDRVSILNRGRVTAEGRIDDLLRVAGRASVRVGGMSGGLPQSVRDLTDDIVVDGGIAVFSVADADVRRVVDLVDDAGGSVLALLPKRESLEDYFTRMLEDAKGGGLVMRRILSLAGAVFADAIRRRVVIVVVFFGALMALAIPSLPNYGLGVVQGVYREVALALTFVGALALTLALAANRVPGEIERRTVYNVVSRPVGRWEYLVGTWLGVVAVMGAVIAGFTVVQQALALANYQDPMWRLWQGALAIWMEMGVVAAFCVAVSALAGPVVVVVSALALLFIGHNRDGALGANAPAAMKAAYPSLDTFNIINPVAHGLGVDAAYLVGMTLAFVGWCGVLLLLGALAFRRRDL